MNYLLSFSLLLLLFTGVASCSESVAEDGSKRGTLSFTGSVTHKNKEYFVFVYNRMEAIESADQSTGYAYYWITYTLDGATGKTVHHTQYETDGSSGNFMGACHRYAFFSADNELYAIDLHADDHTLKPDALKARIASKNPALKGNIASLEIDSYRNLRVLTTTGDLYVLHLSDLEAHLITDDLKNDPAYQLHYMKFLDGEVRMIGNANSGFALTDTTTLILNSYDPSNTHKRFLYLGTHSEPGNYLEMVRGLQLTKTDSIFFLDGSPIGVNDSLVTMTFLTALGTTGTKMIGTYHWKQHRFLWSKPASSLYTPVENSSGYTISWSQDGKSFFIGALTNDYAPFSLVDAATGKIRWKF